MQTVLQFLPSLFAAGGATTGASLGGALASQAAAGGGGGLDLLSSLRVGTSAISGLSSFAAGRAQQQQAELDAQTERLNASGELLDAQQKANAISDQYNQTVADQLAVASASGYDVSSGSVVGARQFAQTQADRQINIVRQGGDFTAALRRARAFALQAQGKQAAGAGLIKGLTEGAQGLFDLGSLGGYHAGQ